MRKIHESDFPLVVPKRVNLFVGISVVFALLSLAANSLVFAVSYGNLNSKYEIPLLLSPLICSLLGITFGFSAKEIVRNYLAVSKQGCIAEASIYLNLMVLGIFFVFLCGLIYIAPLSD